MSSVRTRMSRQRILDGAWHILDGGEAADLTVDAIARALHMSKSTLYKYFASKEDVVVELVQQACTLTEQDARAALSELEGRPIESAVGMVLELYAEHAERLPRAVLLEPGKLPSACRPILERSWRALHEVSRAGIGGHAAQDVLAATALSTSARAAIVAAAGGEVDLSRGDATRRLEALFLSGLGALAAA